MSYDDDPRFDIRRTTDVIAGPVPVAPVVTNVEDERLVHPTTGPVIERVSAVAAEPVVRVVQPAHSVVPVVATSPAVSTTAYTQRFAPDAIVCAIVGLVLLVMGLIAITRGGFDGPMSLPVVKVLGFTHTTTLGLIEIAMGACLLISGATGSRSGAIFFGSVLGIGAFVGAVQTASFKKNLALEAGLAWLLVLGAVLVVVTALLMPRYLTRRTRTKN
jgi:hypothetical protein